MASMCRKHLGFRPSRTAFKQMSSFVHGVAQHSASIIQLMQAPEIRQKISDEYADSRRRFPMPHIPPQPAVPNETLDWIVDYDAIRLSDLSDENFSGEDG
jgi:hypothetical protein